MKAAPIVVRDNYGLNRLSLPIANFYTKEMQISSQKGANKEALGNVLGDAKARQKTGIQYNLAGFRITVGLDNTKPIKICDRRLLNPFLWRVAVTEFDIDLENMCFGRSFGALIQSIADAMQPFSGHFPKGVLDISFGSIWCGNGYPKFECTLVHGCKRRASNIIHRSIDTPRAFAVEEWVRPNMLDFVTSSGVINRAVAVVTMIGISANLP